MSKEKIAEQIAKGNRFLVTCHLKPDGDAVGSMLGMAAVLRSLGKRTVVYNKDQIPASLRFLPGVDGVVQGLDVGERFDATFVLDTGSRDLLPADFPETEVTGPVIVIDHHAVHDDFGDIVLREVDASATGEVVVRLARHLGADPLPREAAAPLYTSIVTDTGGFRYPGTTPETLRLAADLLSAGVDPWEVAYHVFEHWPIEKLRLLSAATERLELELGGRFALITLSRDLLSQLGATEEMVEGLVNYGRRIAGVEIAALLLELRPRRDDRTDLDQPRTKVSLRSRGAYNVGNIALALGGGGHKAAAGGTVFASLAQTRARVLEEVERALNYKE